MRLPDTYDSEALGKTLNFRLGSKIVVLQRFELKCCNASNQDASLKVNPDFEGPPRPLLETRICFDGLVRGVY